MNVKDLVISLALAIGITLLFQHFFLEKKANVPGEINVSAERVRVMPKTDVYRPLDFEIDFWDKEFNIKPVQTQVETDLASFTFSSEGAALIKADFKHSAGGKPVLIPGIKTVGREDRSFILAFDKKTPYYFELVSKKDSQDTTKLEYKADFDGGVIFKTFTVYKQIAKIDLHIVFEPNRITNSAYRLRLIYNIPSILHAADHEQLVKLQMFDDPLFGIVDFNNELVKKPIVSLLDRYWENPVSFGGLDKYLVVSTVNNDSNFAQRGYYQLYQEKLLRAYLESPQIQAKTEWNLSFYLGLNQANQFEKVDPKLDKLLDFGILAPLSKIFLRLLNFFYGLVGNFGWAIILLVMLIKLVTLPLSWSVEKNSKKMAEISRKTDYLKQKYKNDPAAFNKARNELMQKQGFSSFGGCLLPFLIQIPVFFALRNILITSTELYMSPFLWINNLVAADPFCILPFLFSLCMFVKAADNADPRKKMNSLAMAVFVGAIFSYWSAGLVLYLFVSTLLDLLQSQIYQRYGKA